MLLKEILKKLEQSTKFKEWSKNNPNTFFSYALKMIEDKNEQPWQVGFYNKSTNKMITFIVEEDKIVSQPEEEIFKKPDTEINKIEIERVKISFKEILDKAEKFQKKNYPKELINKTIVILQNLKEYNTIWNITYLTHSFKTINMKVNPEDGRVVNHKIDSLMSFVKK